jgi:RNA polymerase sigma-70 factor (ECF subfamily)
MGARGDRRTFELLVEAHAGSVSAYARAVAPDAWVAEDAVQETFLRAWQYLDSFRGTGSFEGWLIRICRNCLIDQAARKVPEPRESLPQPAEPADYSQDVRDLVARLPVEQREVVALCGLLGYEYADAAALLGVPVGTVRSRLHRARDAVSRQLLAPPDEASA